MISESRNTIENKYLLKLLFRDLTNHQTLHWMLEIVLILY